MGLQRSRAWFVTGSGFAEALLTMTSFFVGRKKNVILRRRA